jgi:hypothetical protein
MALFHELLVTEIAVIKVGPTQQGLLTSVAVARGDVADSGLIAGD